ncbi:hypothetical protein K2173_008233 [Erythroxylum novogranatense]|uniref:non-specific serine/threonine protein kinase n=1 Tax=Erythroxylum novogranatense TaxID=1862640 RepID=A0AAV8TS79_9ROSI|nr:hypothetical protein K2173_008233 [Erythroxylum novogranatense]
MPNLLMIFCSPRISPLLTLLIVTTLLLAKKISCVDSQYLACKPKSCGDGQNISFPFYIRNQQNASCGYPRFEVFCGRNGKPILPIGGNQYVIHRIFYQNQSVRVSNEAVFAGNTSCFRPIQNMSLPEDRFKLSSNQNKSLLLSVCNRTMVLNDTELMRYNIGCYGDNTRNDSVIAMLENDPLLSYKLKQCSNVVKVPVTLEEDRPEGGEMLLKRALERGFMLNWTASNCSECEKSGGRCGFDSKMFQFKCYCPDRPHSRSCKPENDKLKLELGLGIGIGGSFILTLLYAVWHQCTRRQGSSKFLSKNSFSSTSSKADTEGEYLGVPIFSYNELREATKYFCCENELGDGGFGIVYYGKLPDGREVAVKRLYEHNYRKVEQFMNEVQILTRLRHKNLVSLYGCTSRHSRQLLLVYEYISNGTVADHLHGEQAKSSPLTWPIRMSIALETACALVYLHASGIIHRDVKTNNILLDDKFCVKVADFGISRLFPNDVTHVSTIPQGSPGYVDPEYHKFYQLTDKSDVYSFGVVLIELISSMPAVDITRDCDEINLSNLAVSKIQERAHHELIDPCLGCESDENVKRMATAVAELAFQCLQQKKEMRPSMEKVLEELKRIEVGESIESQQEMQNKVNVLNDVVLTSSPPNTHEDALLKEARPPSPKSVTENWYSACSTSTSGSGL